MYSIVIVDDERIDRDAYRLMITKNLPQLRIVAETDNGLSTVKLCIEQKPDMLLIDLKMPGISGLDAIRMIRENGSDIKIIIISAYDYFEYARNALSLNVEGYLVKPISESELVAELTRVIEVIELDRKRVNNLLDIYQSMNNLMPILHSRVIQSMRSNDISTLELLSKILEKNLVPSRVVAGACCIATVPHFFETFLSDVKARYGKFFILSSLSQSVLIMLFNGDLSVDKVTSIVRRIRDLAYEKYSLHMSFSVSKPANCLEDLSNALFMAAFSVCGVCDITLCETTCAGYSHLLELENNFINKLLHVQPKESISILKEMMTNFTQSPEPNIAIIRFVLYRLHLKLKRLTQEVLQNVQLERKSDGDTEYDMIVSLDELYNYFEARILGLCTKIDTIDTGHHQSKISHILQYLKSNYCNDIPLAEAAKHFFLSPGYFGKLLRHTTSMSYTEYVTTLRISRAKELLLSTDKSISELSDETGYKDPNYFTKVFKKYTGVTPMEFKKKSAIP